MKKMMLFGLVFFMIAFFAISVQAQPTVGKWDSRDGDFDEGSWSETLLGGGEGQVDNELAAEGDCYRFGKAFLSKVKLISPLPDKYRTIYKGGKLKLLNDPSCPWYNGEDPHSKFIAISKKTIVRTTKYDDGEMSFRLTYKGKFKHYQCFTAAVVAKYNKGLPYSTGSGEEGDPVIISGELSRAKITIKGPVAMDIKPGSCPNPINVKSKGVLPVAILGAGYLDVKNIDPDSIELEGVEPLRWAFEDVAAPMAPCEEKLNKYDCSESGPDGLMDLTLKFDTQEIVDKLGLQEVEDREELVLKLTGKLEDGTPFTGEDVVLILNKNKK